MTERGQTGPDHKHGGTQGCYGLANNLFLRWPLYALAHLARDRLVVPGLCRTQA